MSKKASVSVVVLAYNEAKNLPAAIETTQKAMDGKFSDYEIVIVNDGSKDTTGAVAESIAKRNGHVRVVHNPGNRGCAYSFLHGARVARCDYCWLIPGDGEITGESISSIAERIGQADMVVPYPLNSGIRPRSRRVVSWGYTTLVNVLFGRGLHYYNGPCAIRTDLVRSTPTKETRGFAFMAPLLLRLIRRGHSYVEVGITLKPRDFGEPTVSSVRNIGSGLKTLSWLFWDIHVGERFRKAR